MKKIFLFLFLISFNVFAAVDVCPGNVISPLDGATTTATSSVTATLPPATSYFYSFTPAIDGTIQVDSFANRSFNSLYIKDGCGATLWSATNDSNNKSSPDIIVTAGQLIVIEFERRWSTSIDVTINFTFAPIDPRELCPGVSITNLDGTSTSATDSFSGVTVPANTTFYYSFTPAVDGRIQTNSNAANATNSLYIKDGCGANLWSDTADSDNKSSPAIDVTAGQLIVIAFERDYTTQTTLDIDFTFTVPGPEETCPGITLPNLDGTNATATDSNSSVTVAANATYYYSFTPTSAGTIQVNSTLNDSDNDLYIKDGCGADLWSQTFDSNSKSSPEVAVNAGQLIVIAFTNDNTGSRVLDIDFTYTVPVATALGDNFSTPPNTDLSANVLLNDTGPGIVITADTNATDLAHGTLISFDWATGDFVYRPDTDYLGTDSFTYTIQDSNGQVATATVTITVIKSTDYESTAQPFALINPASTRNITGDYRIAGNSMLCLTSSTTAWGFPCIDDEEETSNGNMAEYIDIDEDNSTWNSSSSVIKLPSTYDPGVNGSGIKWAGLFWSGRISTDNDQNKRMGVVDVPDVNYTLVDMEGAAAFDITALAANKIKFKIDDGNYTDVQADTLYDIGSTSATSYAAFADVTKLLQDPALVEGNNTITVANLTHTEGREESPGHYGGWSLVVIFGEDINGKNRNISVYKGFIEISSSITPPAIEISGFKLPSTGSVSSNISIFSGEGEKIYGDGSNTDWLKISDNDTDAGVLMPNVPPPATNTNIFDGRMAGILREDVNNTANLQINNNVGVEIDSYDVSDLMSGFRDDNPDIDTIWINAYSDQDYITANMMVFSAELYKPGLCYDTTYDIGGYVIESVNNDINTSFHTEGFPLSTHLTLRSLEGDFDLNDVNITITTNTDYLSYQDGSAGYSPNGIRDYDPILPPQINGITADNSSFTLNVGDGAGVSGGTFTPLETHFLRFNHDFNTSQSSINTAISYVVHFTTNYGSGPVEVTQVLNSSNLCSGSSYYAPAWGSFNIVDDAAGPNDYNLYTQVSGRNFDVKAVGYEADYVTPTNYNTNIEVEVYNVEFFKRDSNLSCMNPDSNVSEPFFVRFNNTDSVSIPSLAFPIAKQNSAFRMWYLTDTAGALVPHTAANRYDETYFENLYAAAASGPYTGDGHCNSQCTDGTASNCYQCLRKFYGQPICSRDNFSIRPETFRVTLSDAATIGTNSLATAYPLAASYDYQLAIAATLYGSDSPAEGYVQSYAAAPAAVMAIDEDLDTAASMINQFTGNAACNDINSEQFPFSFWQGAASNSAVKTRNVGDYKFHILDSEWTSVDNPGNFPIPGGDCIPADASVPATGKVGCNVSSSYDATHNDLAISSRAHSFDISAMQFQKGPVPPAGININAANAYTYQNNIAANGDDLNMSVRYTGRLRAVGQDNASLSNYVAGCYAQNLDLDVNTSNLNLAGYPIFSYRLRERDAANAIVNDTIRGNNGGAANLNGLITLPGTNFDKTMGGEAELELNVNFNRAVNTAVNPIVLTYNNLRTICSTPADCQSNADGSATHDPKGNLLTNQPVTHLYGRVHTPRQRVADPDPATISAAATVPVYYEFYCDGACNVGALAANPAISPQGILSPDDVRWYTQALHNTALDGNATATQARNTADNARFTTRSIDPGAQTASYTYNGSRGYPYKTTIDLNASDWLIYNRYDGAAPANDFEIEYFTTGRWGGEDQSNMSVDANTSTNVNRRIQW